MSAKKSFKGIAAFLVVISILGCAAGFGYGYIQNDISGKRNSSQSAAIEITQYDYAYDVGMKLKNAGIIKSDTLWNYWMEKNHSGFAFVYGEFNFKSDMSYEDIANKLQNPDVSHALVKVTIPEGFNIYDIAARLEEARVCSKNDFLEFCKNGDDALNEQFPWISEFPENELRAYKLEGFLFPATYDFAENTNARDVAVSMLKAFDDRYTDEIREGCKKLNMSLYDMITLASVVQEEALTNDSAKNIASVFINRLGINQKLQSDVTIFYANKLKENGYSQEVLDAYNCYKCDALPAGPVCNPGLEIIDATINYSQTDYYYFFSDLQNEFHFAKTYNEFETLKAKYPWQ